MEHIKKQLKDGLAYFSFTPRLTKEGFYVYWITEPRTGNVVRVGITERPHQIEDKKGGIYEITYFPVSSRIYAERMANTMLCKFGSIEQKLFNCYSEGQVKYRARGISRCTIDEIVAAFNDMNDEFEVVYIYNGKKWASKRAIDSFLDDMITFDEVCKERDERLKAKEYGTSK